MRLPRIFVESPLSAGSSLALAAGPTRHLTQVLRLTVNAPLILFNGDGRDYPARLIDSQRAAATVLVEGATELEEHARISIHLALGISKGERMDYALQKAVELGVERLTPLFTERSQVRLDGARLERRLEHWRGIVIGACEQSGRRRLPRLDSAITLESWLANAPAGGLLLDPMASLSLAGLSAPATDVTLLVGPEGGLSPREREQAHRRGFQGVRLGPRILRTETAPLAAIAVIQALWGDFS
jgi:16S rRNA (uracil1498-N3)-methyltransferase